MNESTSDLDKSTAVHDVVAERKVTPAKVRLVWWGKIADFLSWVHGVVRPKFAYGRDGCYVVVQPPIVFGDSGFPVITFPTKLAIPEGDLLDFDPWLISFRVAQGGTGIFDVECICKATYALVYFDYLLTQMQERWALRAWSHASGDGPYHPKTSDAEMRWFCEENNLDWRQINHSLDLVRLASLSSLNKMTSGGDLGDGICFFDTHVADGPVVGDEGALIYGNGRVPQAGDVLSMRPHWLTKKVRVFNVLEIKEYVEFPGAFLGKVAERPQNP